MAGGAQHIITERAETHGDFADNAAVAQAIKTAMRSAGNWESLAPWQKESLDLIATKIGRIMSGDPSNVDHWADISGYSSLVANRLIGGSDIEQFEARIKDAEQCAAKPAKDPA